MSPFAALIALLKAAAELRRKEWWRLAKEARALPPFAETGCTLAAETLANAAKKILMQLTYLTPRSDTEIRTTLRWLAETIAIEARDQLREPPPVTPPHWNRD